MHKPYSESCSQNREPIFEIIEPLFAKIKTVFEVGSGTGQHAVYFAKEMTHLTWQTSDNPDYHNGIRQWIEEAHLPNVQLPVALQIPQDAAPKQKYDAVYSANTLHIMSTEEAECFFSVASGLLENNGLLVVYGPFNYEGKYTSASNAQFDKWLYNQNPKSCIKDFEIVNVWAKKQGLVLEADHEMPANNRILHWIKKS